MPHFRLASYLVENCPECQTEATIPLVAGRQIMKCSNCDANLSFEFPSNSAVLRDVIDRVKQVEKLIDESYFNRP